MGIKVCGFDFLARMGANGREFSQMDLGKKSLE